MTVWRSARLGLRRRDFHLMPHAFFQGVLFRGGRPGDHRCTEQDCEDGGLRKTAHTYGTAWVGFGLALYGSGFKARRISHGFIIEAGRIATGWARGRRTFGWSVASSSPRCTPFDVILSSRQKELRDPSHPGTLHESPGCGRRPPSAGRSFGVIAWFHGQVLLFGNFFEGALQSRPAITCWRHVGENFTSGASSGLHWGSCRMDSRAGPCAHAYQFLFYGDRLGDAAEAKSMVVPHMVIKSVSMVSTKHVIVAGGPDRWAGHLCASAMLGSMDGLVNGSASTGVESVRNACKCNPDTVPLCILPDLGIGGAAEW